METACSDIVDDFEALAFAVGLLPADGFDGAGVTPPFRVSALHGSGVDNLHAFFLSKAVAAPWLFPAGTTTNLTPQQLAMETVREKVYRKLHQELPYRTQLDIRVWHLDKDSRTLTVDMDVAVATRGAVKMLLGRGGSTVQWVVDAARRDLQQAFNCHVKLTVHVRRQQ